MKLITHINRHLLSVALATFAFAAIAGCATYRHAYLVPAPNASLSNGGQGAVATAANVTITVLPNSWNGRPRNLYTKVTPVKVRIQNNSDVPIRLVYEDFNLESPRGQTFAALPPSEITGVQAVGQNQPTTGPRVIEAAYAQGRGRVYRNRGRVYGRTRIIITPTFGWHNFYYAPYWGYGYYGLNPWPYGWAPNALYFNTYYPYMSAVKLPTRSMLKNGLPEGVIAPGGYVEGFLYFSKIGPDIEHVDFAARLQNANTGAQIATINIPFEVHSQPD